MRTESKKWKLIENKEIFDFSTFDNYLSNYLTAKDSYSESRVWCEGCGNSINKEEDWKAFQLKSRVNIVESGGKIGYRLANPIIEFYCFSCQVAEREKGGGDDIMPPQIQTKKTSLIENNPEEREEGEKDEFGENSEQGSIEEIREGIKGIIEMTKLLEQKKEEKEKLSKEEKNQENSQKIKRLEEEIKQLEKELDEIKKNAKLSLGTVTS